MRNQWVKLGGLLGIAYCIAGFVLIFLGWNGTASKDDVPAQIPYIVSGGIAGLGLVVVGAALIVAHSLRTDRVELRAAIEDLRAAVEREPRRPPRRCRRGRRRRRRGRGRHGAGRIRQLPPPGVRGRGRSGRGGGDVAGRRGGRRPHRVPGVQPRRGRRLTIRGFRRRGFGAGARNPRMPGSGRGSRTSVRGVGDPTRRWRRSSTRPGRAAGPATRIPPRPGCGCCACAQELFARHGYEGTSNRTIARASGLTSGAIYHYFPSKADLYAAVYEVVFDKVFSEFEKAVADHHTLVAQYAAVLDAAAMLNREDPLVPAFVIGVAGDSERNPELKQLLRPLRRRNNEFFRRLVAQAAERGELQPGRRSSRRGGPAQRRRVGARPPLGDHR